MDIRIMIEGFVLHQATPEGQEAYFLKLNSPPGAVQGFAYATTTLLADNVLVRAPRNHGAT